jgi:hypothetical protein
MRPGGRPAWGPRRRHVVAGDVACGASSFQGPFWPPGCARPLDHGGATAAVVPCPRRRRRRVIRRLACTIQSEEKLTDEKAWISRRKWLLFSSHPPARATRTTRPLSARVSSASAPFRSRIRFLCTALNRPTHHSVCIETAYQNNTNNNNSTSYSHELWPNTLTRRRIKFFCEMLIGQSAPNGLVHFITHRLCFFSFLLQGAGSLF